MSVDSIKVAVRVRPLLTHELIAGSKTCIKVYPTVNQLKINNESFTFNYVFDTLQGDPEIFNKSVKPLLSDLFKGYNLTVLAYGQTGSGKTHSMGTSCGLEGGNELGVIPKSINSIFESIAADKDAESTVNVSFLEVIIGCWCCLMFCFIANLFVFLLLLYIIFHIIVIPRATPRPLAILQCCTARRGSYQSRCP